MRALEIPAATLTKLDQDIYRFLEEGCVPHSFAANTPVLMADGTSKAIHDVQPGDYVRTTHPVSGRPVIEPVTRLFTNRDTQLTDVTVNPGNAAANEGGARARRRPVRSPDNHRRT